MKIWLLIVIVVNRPFVGPMEIISDSFAYKTAEHCLKIKAKLERDEEFNKKYDNVYIDCRERELK